MLLWSCGITIFACTWTVLHLNVPGLKDTAWQRVLRKTKWMIINVLFPELILSKAICDLRLALEELREFDEYQRTKDPITWTTSFANEFRTYGHQWRWEVGYPRHHKLLYRLLGLQPPRTPKEARQDTETGHSISTPSPTEPIPPRDPALPVGSPETEDGNLVAASIQDDRQRNGRDQVRIVDRPLGSKPQHVVEESGKEQEQLSPEHKISTPAMNFDELTKDGTGIGPPSDGDVNDGVQARDIVWETTQKWTAVHSYYAQMGGLVYIDSWTTDAKGPSYYTLTASKLTSRYFWSYWQSHHPLTYLVLGEQDIQDKSKADGLVKALAVLQATWLVLDVAVRGIMGLPVTQLEVATVAFSVMAIAIYLANWWKPKDVSHPTILQSVPRGTSTEGVDRSQRLTVRLWSPVKAADQARRLPDVTRVPNDSVWIEGDRPPLFILMAVWSLIFGGLHCLAWNFEFPTRAELICWRVAGLASAIVPVLALGLSLIFSYLATNFIASRLISTLLAKLEPLEQLPTEWWEYVTKPTFLFWGLDAIRFLISMPTGSRNWEEEPSLQTIQASLLTDKPTVLPSLHVTAVARRSTILRYCMKKASEGRIPRPSYYYNKWMGAAMLLKESLREFKEVYGLDFLRDYESYVRDKLCLSHTDFGMPESTQSSLEHIIAVHEQIDKRMDMFRRACTRASTFMAICSGILYTAARLTIIVLLFTCLRATPAGVYDNTPWTRFLPSFS